ncbi:hypothetical protein Gotur_009472 [Gossypium turneri]
MADPSNLSAVSSEDAGKFGFRRDEMYSSTLAGTVNPYDRHLFLRHKSYNDWASRVEEDGLPNLLSSALKSRKNDIPVKTLLTVIEGAESDGDVLVFPEMTKYNEGIFMLILFYCIDGRGLTDSDVEGFVEDVLVNGKPWASGVQETLTGSYIFVCAHGNRDKRCGVCGPALIQKLSCVDRRIRYLERSRATGNISISISITMSLRFYVLNGFLYYWSFAFNGCRYGYVTPEDVPELLDQQIAKGEIIQHLWSIPVCPISGYIHLLEMNFLPQTCVRRSFDPSTLSLTLVCLERFGILIPNTVLEYFVSHKTKVFRTGLVVEPVRPPLSSEWFMGQPVNPSPDQYPGWFLVQPDFSKIVHTTTACFTVCLADENMYNPYIYRGQMGASTEGGDKTDEQKLPNGTEVKKNEKHEETTTQKTKENVDGCCQGANGFTCCMTASLEANEKEKSEEPREVCGKTGMCKLTSWVESWEQHHVLTAAAVVGVVATIAVAYSYYRRSG